MVHCGKVCFNLLEHCIINLERTHTHTHTHTHKKKNPLLTMLKHINE